MPTSTARTPVLAAIWGPMVEPQGQSLRTCFFLCSPQFVHVSVYNTNPGRLIRQLKVKQKNHWETLTNKNANARIHSSYSNLMYYILPQILEEAHQPALRLLGPKNWLRLRSRTLFQKKITGFFKET